MSAGKGAHDAIGVVDFGGQYAHLIATKVRRHRVLAEICQPDDPIERFSGFKGLILSGSPSLSSRGEDSGYTRAIYDLDIPILGICFGHQEVAKHYGGVVVHGGREWGRANLHVIRAHPLFEGLGPVEQVWMSHFDSVVSLGPDFEELGWTTLSESEAPHRYAAICSDRLRRYGFQFHPEVDDTTNGDRMLANFVFRVCGCRPTWTMDCYLDEQVARIRAQAGDRSVFLLASGGVDSTVAARVIVEALGVERLNLLHVDNGLMRKGESETVLQMLRFIGLGQNLHFVDASNDFLTALRGVVEPEEKRRIIGDTFIHVFEREAARLGLEEHILAQGTIYPDTIETGGTRRAHVIKTHHNRVPMIERMIAQGRVVEPLVDLYKVEVRELGERLGLPEEVLSRHPFPGPGLGVRLLCSNGRPDTEGFDVIMPKVEEIAARFGLLASPMPFRSVGVKADLRSYEHPIVLSGEADWERLMEASGLILREVPGVNRCVWNLSSEHPSSFRPIAAYVSRERLDLLREADALVMEGLRRYGMEREVWQCPTVLVPLEISGRGRELVIVRPVRSERAMTASPARLPDALLDDLRRAILGLPWVSGLFLDLTSKPPGTIEWE